MDRVAGELSAVTQRWGVAISFVKFQRVDAGQLTEVLAKRKNAGTVRCAAAASCAECDPRGSVLTRPYADLENQSIIIRAKATKQKTVIESEGIRDRTIREAEGEAQQLRSRGECQSSRRDARPAMSEASPLLLGSTAALEARPRPSSPVLPPLPQPGARPRPSQTQRQPRRRKCERLRSPLRGLARIPRATCWP